MLLIRTHALLMSGSGLRGRCWLLMLLCLLVVVAGLPSVAAQDPPAAGDRPQSAESADWAKAYLSDPLSSIDSPSIDQLREAIKDPKHAIAVVSEHFPRSQKLVRDVQRQFLVDALEHEAIEVRQQAAIQLDRLGMLGELISERLLQLAIASDQTQRDVGILGLEIVSTAELPRNDDYIESLIQALTSESDAVRNAAADQLQRLGPVCVPALLDALNDPERASQVARILGGIAHPRRMEQAVVDGFCGDLSPSIGGVPEDQPVAKGLRTSVASSPADPLVTRQWDQTKANTVRVFYGTNRELADPLAITQPYALMVHGAIALAAVGLLFWGVVSAAIRLFGAQRLEKPQSPCCWLLLSIPIWAVFALWSFPTLGNAVRGAFYKPEHVNFGPRRSESGKKHYGFCDISIPPNHEVGMVETPLWGTEDEDKHVVLKSTELLEEEAFFDSIRRLLAATPDPKGCFVFIHGYNVSFESAAKRTAQIHFDLNFQGVPIFYSWPSRASIRHYFSDRNEIQYSRQLIKDFLLDVANRTDAKRVHVIAHSMGADAVAGAIASMEPGVKVFDQIILAAPDIDADIFRSQIVPKLQQVSNRTTLYCSRNDLALHASYHFNDSWRAGDSSRGLLMEPGIDTIDASSIDTELLGHSYYGNCIDILDDVSQLFRKNTAPGERKLVSLAAEGAVSAWTFPRLINLGPR